MLVHEQDLPKVYSLAMTERMRGQSHICVEVVPRVDVARLMTLWEGIPGLVVGRVYYEDPDLYNADIPTNRTVRALKVRVRITDIIEAMRRFKKREAMELAQPTRANAIRVRKAADTMR